MTTPIEGDRDAEPVPARGQPKPARELLPLVYDELRKLAAQRMSREVPGQTLQATALVHEAYLRLVGGDPDRPWDGRGHASHPRRERPAPSSDQAWGASRPRRPRRRAARRAADRRRPAGPRRGA